MTLLSQLKVVFSNLFGAGYFLISHFVFRVSVCPPVDTLTNLNNDLVTADDTLDNDTKDLLIKLSAEIIEDVAFLKKFEEQELLKEENKFKNWYLGHSTLLLPSTEHDKIPRYLMKSTALSGSVSSPLFGHQYREDRFIKKMEVKCEISFPGIINTLAGNLVVEIKVDTKESVGGTDSFDMMYPTGTVFNKGYINQTLRYTQ